MTRPDTSWMESARCSEVDAALWFPPKGGSNRDAKRICRTCEVITECLAYALTQPNLDGVWAATSPRERRRLGAIYTKSHGDPRGRKPRHPSDDTPEAAL